MIKLQRTDSDNEDFVQLVSALDAELASRDGSEHSFYAQFNSINRIKHVVVAYEEDKAVGCGAIKEFTSGIMEVKRMYTLPEYRGRGIAAKILGELESWTAELGCQKCVLETGKRQPEAIALYKKNDYRIIPNYGQYVGVENSVCFEKEVKHTGDGIMATFMSSSKAVRSALEIQNSLQVFTNPSKHMLSRDIRYNPTSLA